MPTSQSAPDQASAHHLGDPVRAFDARPGRRRALAWLILLGLAGIVLVPAAAVYLAAGRLLLGVPAALLAVGYLGAVGWILSRGVLRGRGIVVTLHQGGLAVTGSGRSDVYLWDDLSAVTVSGVQRARHARTRWRFTVATTRGGTLEFGDELPDVRLLGETVVAEVTARVVPPGLAALEAGRAVRFGPFTVSPAGVGKEGQRVPWPALRDVVIANGVVTVRSADGVRELSALTGHTPNAVALAELCRRTRTAHRA
ncbi:DUF6585 family protein [Actinomadura hibisca]|uniref:DUF6585 family protein n=1 Tax=Actinomadura hibisca TaxID=68565 RepID=UPI00083633FB|nr:DUF6585 family protein [Actinomadura hibisca]